MRLKGAAILIFLWYLISALTDLPYPHEVAEVFFFLLFNSEPVLGKTLVQHAVASLFRVLAASFLAFSVAIPLGIISGWNRTFMEVIAPAVEALRPIPPLAWIPLAYVIFAPLPNTVQISQIS